MFNLFCLLSSVPAFREAPKQLLAPLEVQLRRVTDVTKRTLTFYPAILLERKLRHPRNRCKLRQRTTQGERQNYVSGLRPGVSAPVYYLGRGLLPAAAPGLGVDDA
jgi:hypothetical protein